MSSESGASTPTSDNEEDAESLSENSLPSSDNEQGGESTSEDSRKDGDSPGLPGTASESCGEEPVHKASQHADQEAEASSTSSSDSSASRSASPSSQSDSESSSGRQGAHPKLCAARAIPAIFETTEAHIERHAYPAHVRDCPRCRFVHNREKWEEDCTFTDPRTGCQRIWLIEQPDPLKKPWHLGCLVCMQAGKEGMFGRCKAGAKLSNLRRHASSDVHIQALQELSAKGTTLPEGEEAPGGPAGNRTFAHVLFERTLIAKGGSFEEFQKYCECARLAGASLGFGSIGSETSAKLAGLMAEKETAITSRFLRSASVAGICQDGLGDAVASRLRMLCWKWPRGVDENVAGVKALNGSRGPWLVDRIAAVSKLSSDHSAMAKAALLRQAISKNCCSEEDFKHAQSILRFFASDAAPDEVQAGHLSSHQDFPHMRFQSTDPAHASMLAIKSAFLADEEVQSVDRVLVSGKNPASLSKLLRTSTKLQDLLKEAQQAECLQILSHFGFAPQRFDSKKVPMGRVCMRLRQAFTVLAYEAENGEEKRRHAATHILEELTGPHSMRLVLAGMMADLCHEHSRHVRAGDRADCDPMILEKGEQMFLSRLSVLFKEGLIVTTAAKNTFTGQVLKFLAEPKVMFFKKKALIISLGQVDKDDELFQPLNRMRLVCRAITQMMHSTRPSFCWGKRFLSFGLPSPFLKSAGSRERTEAAFRLH